MVSLPPAPAELGALCALALDAVVQPLALLRADGTLLHANPAAQRALAPGGAWQRGSHGHLHPRDPAARAAFSAALKAIAIVESAPEPAADAVPAPVLSPFALVRLPSLAAVAAQGPALLLALPPPAHGAADVTAFARRFDLTDAETRVLEQLLQGHGAQQAAHALGVSTSTVRSQVLSLRRKTGHRSVPALLAALRGAPVLLLPPT
jgi:DNA-binding CsgD family transcriptional regulator